MHSSIFGTRLAFAFNKRRTYLYALVFLAAIVALDQMMAGKFLTAEHSWWKDFLDPLVGLGTLFTAFAVWWEEIGQDWRGNLPKRLTVEFFHGGRLVMRCEGAHLADESDIRALSQQIGAQIAGTQKLDLKIPSVEFGAGEVKPSSDSGFEMCYTAKFELTSLPDKLKMLEDREYFSWSPPFEKVERPSLPRP
jgi:hypothetical protein